VSFQIWVLKQKWFKRKPTGHGLRGADYMSVFGWSTAWNISDEQAYKMC
jgi:hypothetical protein